MKKEYYRDYKSWREDWEKRQNRYILRQAFKATVYTSVLIILGWLFACLISRHWLL